MSYGEDGKTKHRQEDHNLSCSLERIVPTAFKGSFSYSPGFALRGKLRAQKRGVTDPRVLHLDIPRTQIRQR